MSIVEGLAGRRVCVCAGAGGVGKTTVSAAIAIGLAARGARVAVVTIDPARRLADVLASGVLGNEPQQLAVAALSATDPAPGGELWAMMLDARRTTDDLVATLAPDAATREAIRGDRIYRELSAAVAGVQEFAAVAKVAELVSSERFDVVVLDTPPSRSAQAFLDAPGALSAFLAERPLRRVAALAGAGGRAGLRGGGTVVSALRRVTGVGLLADLGRFLSLMETIGDGLARHAQAVELVLARPDTAFVVVAAPQRAAVDEAIALRRRLADRGMSYGGLVVNRVLLPAADEPPGDPARAAEEVGGDADVVARALVAWRLLHTLARHDAEAVERLAARTGEERPLLVPRLAAGIRGRDGLIEVQRALFADDEGRRALLGTVTF